MNNTGITSLTQLIFSVFVFIFVYGWYHHKERKLRWNVSYKPMIKVKNNKDMGYLITIINASGEKAHSYIKLLKVTVKTRGKLTTVNKQVFQDINYMTPISIDDGNRIIRLKITFEELTEALKKGYIKLFNPKNNDFGATGLITLWFIDNKNNIRKLTFQDGFASIKIPPYEKTRR